VANYVKGTNFAIKDGLPSGNPSKIVKGTEIDVEFTAIAGAIATKADINSPAFIGTPTAPTAATGTDTTQLATTEFVNNSIVAERDEAATLTLKTLTSPTINGGLISNASISGGTISSLSSPITVPNGGTGRTTLTASNLLVGNGAGNVNFIAPGANNTVLTSNGTSWSAQALTNIPGSVSVTSGSAPYYGARAWVNFDGFTGTIRGSGNVSSITRSGTGVYVVNFTTAMANANYSVSIGPSNAAGNVNVLSLGVSPYDAVQTTTNVTLRNWTPNVGGADTSYANVSIFS
jgi:hypothetical protein